jgi:hypothetical protein
VVFVPRPPQPPGVGLAVLLTYCGVILAGIVTVLDLTYLSSIAPDAPSLAQRVLMFVYVAGWLVPSAGAVVAAIFTRRGSNAGRVVLASLMGVYALINLCQGLAGFGYLGGGGGPAAREGGLALVSYAMIFVLAGLSIATVVLLLLPSASRYFSPGPGRRWAPTG